MASAADVIVLDDDSPDEEAVLAVAEAAPCKRPPTSSKKRRLALAPLPPLQQPLPLQRAPAAAGAVAGAASDDDDVIDLTGDDDAVAAAFRDWELIDLTGVEDEPAGRGAKAARHAPQEPPAVVDELGEARAKIQAFLRARGTVLKVQRCDANPHALPGTPLYERFVAARRRCRDQRLQLVFHGTAAANVDSICRNGLDPKRRAGQAMGPGEYFGKEAAISVAYCKGGKKMLIFAVLCDKSGITADVPGVVVVHRPAHQLPLFVITFQNVKPQDMMAAINAQMGAAGGAAAAPGPFWGLPPAPTFTPFSGGGRMLSAPVRHTLRRAAPVAPGAPPQLCRSCVAALRGGELALGRTADGAPQQLDLYHLRCAATAAWAPEVPLQPLLRDFAAASGAQQAPPGFAPVAARAHTAPLTERELAVIYEELGSDERRAMLRAR